MTIEELPKDLQRGQQWKLANFITEDNNHEHFTAAAVRRLNVEMNVTEIMKNREIAVKKMFTDNMNARIDDLQQRGSALIREMDRGDSPIEELQAKSRELHRELAEIKDILNHVRGIQTVTGQYHCMYLDLMRR